MKTNWQSYLELTDDLLASNDYSLEVALLARDGAKQEASVGGMSYWNGAISILLIYRERLMRDTGTW